VDASDAASSDERKIVTVLFADVTGSTTLGERLDPEHLREVMQTYFAAMRSEIEAGFARVPNGPAMLQALFGAVKTALAHGLQVIFFWSAVIMTGAVFLHLLLRNEPLRTRTPEPEVAAH